MDEKYTVYPINNERDIKRLLRNLLKNGTPSRRSNLKPASDIFNLVYLRGCKTVVVEDPYMDSDHRKCHVRLHYLAQSAVSRYCKRLHFFSKPVTLSEMRVPNDETKSHYMGMCVFRPINAFPIGRTLLSSDKLVSAPSGKNWIPYVTCKAKYPVHIAGNLYEVTASPFIQQDHMVSACATASIWMSQWYMSQRYDEFKRFYSPEITDAATLYELSVGRSVPSEGLTNKQVLQAFRALEYDPIPYDLRGRPALVALRYLYRIIESEIPVSVGIIGQEGGHLITAFGHAINDGITPDLLTFPPGSRKRDATKYIDSSDYSAAFLVNDDASSPYRWMELYDIGDLTPQKLNSIFTISNRKIRKLTEFLTALSKIHVSVVGVFYDITGQADFLAGIDFLAAPVPRAVTLPPKEAQDKALSSCDAFMYNILKIFGTPIVRTYLTTSESYKRHIGNVINIDSKFSWWIRSFYYPKWIWVTEFSILELNNGLVGRKVVASVLIDSSASRDTIDFVLMHILGLVVPVERNQYNVFSLLKDISSRRQRAQVDHSFRPYLQLER